MSEADEQQYGVSRLVAFSDGVFAFAMTLLITTIPFSFPNLPPSASNEQMVQQLLALLPNFYAYAFSFYMVGYYWVIHHRTFRKIIKFDTPLLWINLTLLFFIVFLPLPTSLLGRYGDNAVITALYAATHALLSLIYMILHWYTSSHHRLIAPAQDEKTIRFGYLRGLMAFSFFTLSIGLSFLSPLLAKLVWIAVLFVRPVVLSKYRPEGS